MQNRSRNDGRLKRRGRARIARHVCTWVSLTSLMGCAVREVDLNGRECPCISGWVCVEQTQLCVLATQVGTGSQDDGPLDSEPRDTGRANPPVSPERVDAATTIADAATAVADAATAVADAEITNGTPSDAGRGDDPEDGGFVDADTPDAAHDDAGQEAGVVIPPNPDAGSEPCEPSSALLSGESKGVGEYLCSSNGQNRFGLSPDGVLQLRTSAGVIWSAGTCCGIRLAMQRDGNLVAYDLGDKPTFATNTRGNDGAFLRVEDDARAVR